MRLKTWIKENNLTYRTFAVKAGVSERNVVSWANGARLPRSFEAQKIFFITNNEVNGHDLYQEQIFRNKANIQGSKV